MHYERKSQPLLPVPKFLWRLGKNIIIGLLLISLAMAIGMIGYRLTEHMSWVDSFVNAAMILSGMGPMGQLATNAGKIFAGLYALFSGLTFILVIGVVFAPLAHRLIHRFHMSDEKK